MTNNGAGRMKALVFGGTGFLGSRIVAGLLQQGHEVWVVTRDPAREVPFPREAVQLLQGDLSGSLSAFLDRLPEKLDRVVYAAMPPLSPGRISNREFRRLAALTERYVLGAVEVARRTGAGLILTSGASFDTRPGQVADESWPIARRGMAALGHSYDRIVAALRQEGKVPLVEILPGQIYGNGGLFRRMIEMARSGRVVILGSGKNRIPRIHVDDCARAFLRVVEGFPAGERFIVADNVSWTVSEFIHELAAHYGASSVRRIPEPILRVVVGKYVYETLTMDTVVSNRHIAERLGWRPVYPSCREGIATLE